MKKIILSILFYCISVSTAFAQFSLPGVGGGGIGQRSGRGGAVEEGLNSKGIGDLFGTGGLLGGNWDIWTIIMLVIYLMLTFAGIVAVFFIILGGYYYMTAGGNGDQATKGKDTVKNAVIGLIIVILAYLIVSIVINTFSGGLFNTGIL